MGSFLSFVSALSDFINLKSVIFVAFVSGFMAFVVAVVIIVIFRKKILIKRKNTLLQLLSYSYIVIFPILFSICISLYFSINTAQKEVVKSLPALFYGDEVGANAHIKAKISDTFGAKVLDRTIGDFLDEHEKMFKEELIHKSVKLEWASGSKIDAVVNYIFLSRPDLLRSAVVQIAGSKLGNSIVGEAGVKQFLDVKIADIVDDGFLYKIIESQIISVFSGVKKKILIIFFLLMLLPLIEIIWSNKQQRKLEEVI